MILGLELGVWGSGYRV